MRTTVEVPCPVCDETFAFHVVTWQGREEMEVRPLTRGCDHDVPDDDDVIWQYHEDQWGRNL